MKTEDANFYQDERMRLTVVQKRNDDGRWECKGPGTVPEKWSGGGFVTDFTGGKTHVRVVTTESAREDYGVAM